MFCTGSTGRFCFRINYKFHYKSWKKRFLLRNFINGMLFVDKKDALMDEEINIQVSGLRPYAEATIRATCMTECKNNTMFQSFAHYKADSNGCISLKKDPSLYGMYTGVDPMGLFWSKVSLENEGITNRRLMFKDLSKPLKTTLDVHDGFLDLKMESFADLNNYCKDMKPKDSVILRRWYLAKDRVEEETVRVGRLRGSVFYPKTPGKFKGIIDIFGSAGGMIPTRAALLASHGFTTFCLPFFKYDDLPNIFRSVEIEYFEEAVDWFHQHERVNENGVGVIGTSAGGMIALLLASRKTDLVKATIAINSPDAIIAQTTIADGRPLPYNPIHPDLVRFNEHGHMIGRDSYYADSNPKKGSQLPTANIKSKILLIAAGDDQSIDSADAGKRYMKRMKKNGKGSLCNLIIYPDAGHLIEPPFAPHCPHAYHGSWGYEATWGGNAKDHAFAQHDAWMKAINFFKENL